MNDGGPAFPTGLALTQQGNPVGGDEGMSLLDWYAGMALQGMCANPDITAAMSDQGMKPYEIRDSFASSAWAQAEEMIKERERRMKE